MYSTDFEDLWNTMINDGVFKRINKTILLEYKEITFILWENKKGKLTKADIWYISTQEKRLEIDLDIAGSRLTTLKKKKVCRVTNKKLTYIIDEYKDKPRYGGDIAIAFNEHMEKILIDSIYRSKIKQVLLDVLDSFKIQPKYVEYDIDLLISFIDKLSDATEVLPTLDQINRILDVKGLFDFYKKAIDLIIERSLYNPQYEYGILRWINGANKYQLSAKYN